MNILLASASPRRKELLKEIYPSFDIISPEVDETFYAPPTKYVKTIALRKANAVNKESDVIISADTIVVYKKTILGKPSSKEDAIKTLTTLSGKKHYVYTGVCIKYIRKDKEKIITFYDKSDVYMKPLSLSEIIDYVNGGSPLDKAGSYGIQDGVVAKHKGSYSNIVGLPIEKLKKILTKHKLI